MIKNIAKISIIFLSTFILFQNFLFAEMPEFKKSKNHEGELPIRVVREIALPEGYHEGLFLDGDDIWVSNGKGIATWIVDLNKGTVISEINPVGTFTEAIVSAGDDTYWMTDWETKKLYRVEIQENKMKVKSTFSLEPAFPTGVIRIKEKVYVITWTRGAGTKYYLLELDDNAQLLQRVRIKDIYEPAHFAWDGRYLWITSWYSSKVHKVDIDTFEILGFFKSPADKATGIAYDGKSFWITGTYDNLYQIELVDIGV